MLPYAVGLGSVLAFVGALALAGFGAVNLWHASFGDAESPGLNAAFGALFLVAAAALLFVSGLAASLALRLRSEGRAP